MNIPSSWGRHRTRDIPKLQPYAPDNHAQSPNRITTTVHTKTPSRSFYLPVRVPSPPSNYSLILQPPSNEALLSQLLTYTVTLDTMPKSKPSTAPKTPKKAGGRSAISDVVAREYTIHLHKRVGFLSLSQLGWVKGSGGERRQCESRTGRKGLKTTRN